MLERIYRQHALYEATLCFEAKIECVNLMIEGRRLDKLDILTEEHSDGIVTKILKATKDLLNKLIDGIVEFFRLCREKISGLFKKKHNKTEDAVIKELKADFKTKEIYVKKKKIKVTVFKNEQTRKLLDDYIREVIKLEREVLQLSKGEKLDGGLVGTRYYEHKLNLIEAKYERLTTKYAELINNTDEKIVELAIADAIRFSEDQLKTVRINYDAMEKGSRKVLQEFVKDADGAEYPLQLNILQKFGRGISTMIRESGTITTKTVKASLTAITLITGALLVAPVAVVKGQMSKNPKVRAVATGIGAPFGIVPNQVNGMNFDQSMFAGLQQ